MPGGGVGRAEADWPRQMVPCPHCMADYPTHPDLWGWIEVAATALYTPDLCSECEADPRQWRDYDDVAH